MSIEIKKAIACNAWDVCFNGKRIKRCDRKYQAEAYAKSCKNSMEKMGSIIPLRKDTHFSYNGGKPVSRASLSHWM